MRFEIERTVLRRSDGCAGGGPDGRGVERFIEAGDSADDALVRFLSRDRSILTGDMVTIGRESVGTAQNDQGLFLLRLQVLEDRS